MLLTKTYGRLCPEVLHPGVGTDATTVELEWSPDEHFENEICSGTSFTLKCCYRSNGDRILLGAFGDSTFLTNTIALGISIAETEGRFAAGESNACRLNFLLYQWLTRKRPGLKRRFRTLADLTIAKAHRENKRDDHLLAHLRGMDQAFNSIENIADLGKEGSMIDRVRSGLQALAKKYPLRIQMPEHIDATIKNALFSTDDIECCNDDALVEDVENRLWRALQNHLSEPTDRFNKWFWGKDANLENKLAKQCEAHDESALSRNEVKAALFEIGWRGHKLMGKMFELGMNEIRAQIPDPSVREDQIHDQLYVCQPHLASLPLAMLLNYRKFALLGFLDHVWAGNVTKQNVDALHTMLYFYSEMVRTRRAADRRAKREKVLELYENVSIRSLLVDDSYISHQIVEALPNDDILTCAACKSSSLNRKFLATAKTIVMSSACKDCGTVQPEKKYPTAKIKGWMMVDGDKIF